MIVFDRNAKELNLFRVLAFAALVFVSNVESAQQTVIDARRISNEKAIKEYHQAINEAIDKKGGNTSLDLRLTLIIDGRTGFDPGFLRLPDSIRRIRVTIDLVIFGGSIANPKTISVNNFELNDARRLHEIRQITTHR
jgi:hypothetical protein